MTTEMTKLTFQGHLTKVASLRGIYWLSSPQGKSLPFVQACRAHGTVVSCRPNRYVGLGYHPQPIKMTLHPLQPYQMVVTHYVYISDAKIQQYDGALTATEFPCC